MRLLLDLIRIVGWNRYQHYKNRNPPWIKLHRELLTSHTWVGCDDASRVLAIAIMLLAAQTDNKIPADPKYLQRVAYLNKPPNLKPLLDSQFIEYIGGASEMLAYASDLQATCASTEKRQSRGESEAEEKIAFGEFGAVKLTMEQRDKLSVKLEGNLDDFIRQLDRYSQTSPSKFKKYKSHYAVILDWYDRAISEGRVKTKPSTKEFNPETHVPRKWHPSEYL